MPLPPIVKAQKSTAFCLVFEGSEEDHLQYNNLAKPQDFRRKMCKWENPSGTYSYSRLVQVSRR